MRNIELNYGRRRSRRPVSYVAARGENGKQICNRTPSFDISRLYIKKFLESSVLECLLLACPTNSNSLYHVCDGPGQFLMVRAKLETRVLVVLFGSKMRAACGLATFFLVSAA